MTITVSVFGGFTEDLGNGYKAIFDIQRRYDLSDGTLGNSNTASYKGSKSATQKDWDGAAWLGLAWAVRSGSSGAYRPRLKPNSSCEFDPVYEARIGVGSQFYGLQRNARIDNTLRYDSPKFGMDWESALPIRWAPIQTVIPLRIR